MTNEQIIANHLVGLTQLSHRSICGGLDKQEIFYRADEVAALVAKLTPAPLADAELAELASISGKLEIEENLDNTSDLVLTEGEDKVFWVAGGVPTEYARAMVGAWNAQPGLLARLAALQAFKDYVHHRFDEANIDRHDEQNAINGCRVGKRFDDLERYMELTDAQKTREALVAVANGLAEAIDNQDNQRTYEVWRNIADVLTSVDSSTISSLRMIVPPTVEGAQANG